MRRHEFNAVFRALKEMNGSQRRQLIARLRTVQAAEAARCIVEERLQWLAACPHGCGLHVLRNGVACGLQRYKCRDCSRTINALAGTPLARLGYRARWLNQAQVLGGGRGSGAGAAGHRHADGGVGHEGCMALQAIGVATKSCQLPRHSAAAFDAHATIQGYEAWRCLNWEFEAHADALSPQLAGYLHSARDITAPALSRNCGARRVASLLLRLSLLALAGQGPAQAQTRGVAQRRRADAVHARAGRWRCRRCSPSASTARFSTAGRSGASADGSGSTW